MVSSPNIFFHGLKAFMKRHLVVLSVAMLLGAASAPLVAADDSTNPFNGFNIGMHGGFGSAQRSGVNSWWLEGASLVSEWGQFKQSGGQVGLHMGYNYVFPSGLLLGGRVSFATSDVNGMTIDSLRDEPDQFTSDGRNRIESIAMAQGRIGYATDSWSVHAIGGFTIATARQEGSFTALTPTPSGPARLYGAWYGSEQQSGWVAGVGAALMLTDRVSVNVDYTFLEFDKVTTGLPGSAGVLGAGSVPTYLTAVVDTDMHLFTVGVSYRL
jgi:opacity protein-like surface antigen